MRDEAEPSCARCGLPIAEPDRITVYRRLNGKMIGAEVYHKEHCCPFTTFGKMPSSMVNDTWTIEPGSGE